MQCVSTDVVSPLASGKSDNDATRVRKLLTARVNERRSQAMSQPSNDAILTIRRGGFTNAVAYVASLGLYWFWWKAGMLEVSQREVSWRQGLIVQRDHRDGVPGGVPQLGARSLGGRVGS